MNAVAEASVDAYIPESLWGKDHWTTLAYAESVMVDLHGFQMGTDPRMRTNRRHARVMAETCPRPIRTQSTGAALQRAAMVMSAEHGTRLNDGRVVAGHDDWMCLQDMAVAGYFTVAVEQLEPGSVIHLSARGQAVAAALRAHKAAGGQFAQFRAPTPGAAHARI